MKLKKSVINDVWNGEVCISEKDYSIKNKEYINNLYSQLEELLESKSEEIIRLNLLYQQILDISEIEAFRKGIKFMIDVYNDAQ